MRATALVGRRAVRQSVSSARVAIAPLSPPMRTYARRSARALPLLPQPGQGRRQQRQQTGLDAGIGDDARRPGPRRGAGRPRSRAARSPAAPRPGSVRPHQGSRVAEQGRERRVARRGRRGSRPARPPRRSRGPGVGHQLGERVEEGCAFPRVGTGGPHLLELVDDQHGPVATSSGSSRMSCAMRSPARGWGDAEGLACQLAHRVGPGRITSCRHPALPGNDVRRPARPAGRRAAATTCRRRRRRHGATRRLRPSARPARPPAAPVRRTSGESATS